MKYCPKRNNNSNNNFISNKVKSSISKQIINENNKKQNKEKSKEKSNKKQSKNKNKNTNIKKKLQFWKKLEFPISQFSGKIINNYKDAKLPKFLDKEDIDIILKLISKESKNFSPVKTNTKMIIIFMLLCLSSITFGIIFLFQKKTTLGIGLILVCFILCFIYIHIIRKSIINKYKQCHRDLFYLTDYINRKYLGDLGYYLLIDYNFKFIGIYIIPNYIREILKFRDHNIELKKHLEGETLNHLHKREIDKSSDNINNFYKNKYKTIFNSNINYFTFGYNNNILNNFNNNNINNNNNNDITIDNDYNSNNNKNKVKFNNFFDKENNNKDIIEKEDIIIDIPLNKRKINNDNKKTFTKIDELINKSLYKRDNKNSNNNNKYKEMNSHANDRSIDKFKDYLENKFNGLGILNDKKK